MRLCIDLSAFVWNTLLASKDPLGEETLFEEKKCWINTANYGYDNAINSITSYIREANAQPRDMIIVQEGPNSKSPRLMIYSGYKAGKGRAPVLYERFQEVRDRLMRDFRALGALGLCQPNVEGDDTIAWICAKTREDLMVATVDNDLAVLNGVNKHGAKIIVSVKHEQAINKYGDFPTRYISLYKAMVGDTGDKIPGIKGFGKTAWMDFHAEFGLDGMEEMVRLGELGSLHELAAEADQNVMVRRIYDGRDDFLKCYRLASLHPEWVDRANDPIEWLPGFVQDHNPDSSHLLAKYAASKKLITADNFDEALRYFKEQQKYTTLNGLDFETSTPPESDDWIESRQKKKADGQNDDKAVKVDVMGSEITGCSISFGRNNRQCFYISIDHTDTKNCGLDQLTQFILSMDPKVPCVAHNAQGFELPVARLRIPLPSDNGWRGFIPNMHDTRIMSYWVNENLMRHGLKVLTKLYFNYDQQTYDEVLNGAAKMNEISGEQVLDYGCDDAYTAAGLFNFFSMFLEFEGTLGEFMQREQKPMYLQAHGYLEGVKLDLKRLSDLSAKDKLDREAHLTKFNQYLITKGWDGSLPPRVLPENWAGDTPVGVSHLAPSDIKEVVKIVLRHDLETQVRTPSKLFDLVEAVPNESAHILAALFRDGDAASIQNMVNARFTAAPVFNIGSPKQVSKLLYDVIGIPVRLRTKPTDLMRKEGREGNPRTDDDAINMAIKIGDVVQVEEVSALKSLLELKYINTRTSLYWTPYPLMLHWMTNRVHPQLRQTATNTRRYAGSDPNVQQMDGSYGGVRSVILPHHSDAIIASLDESAQELRQLADYCQDEAMLSCYLGTKDQLRDIHSIVGARIADVTYAEFRARYKTEDAEVALPEAEKTFPTLFLAIRQKAKITIFSLVYGAGPAKIGETLGITTEDAQAYIDAIFEMFPGIVAWKAETEEFARRNGYVPIHGGGYRHLSVLMNSEDKYTAAKAMRQAGNSRIQASGGNQIKRIMTRIWDSRLLDDFDYRWLFSVHDETVHSIGRKDTVEVLRQLHEFMTEQYLTRVPSASSIGIGKSFGTLKELGEVFDPAKIESAVNDLFETVAA